MAYIAYPDAITPSEAQSTPLGTPLSFWERMLDAIADGRQQMTEKAYVEMIASSGGRLTDDMERRIASRL